MEKYINEIINEKYNTDKGYMYFVDLLIEKYPSFNINLDNLSDLEIDNVTKDMFFDTGFLGIYTARDNKIRLFTNYDDGKEIFSDINISDDDLINTFVHEFIHCISSRIDENIIYEGFNMRCNGQSSYFLGINEGITQMITDDLLECDSDAYVFQTVFARQFAEIIGKDKLISMYSSNDINSFIDSVSMINEDFDFRSFVVDTYLFNMMNCGYDVENGDELGTKIQQQLILLNGSLDNNFFEYMLDKDKVEKLMVKLPISCIGIEDCGFRGIDSIDLDNSNKVI